MKKVLLSGNEAIARGAYEAGVIVATGYPGTPSTEILENIALCDEIYAQWSPNEKVALEVGTGASYGGARTLVTMKHVGLNVAADPLFTLSYTGVRGGLVIVSADDPELYSSQNEQDNRHYAKSSKIPMLEPSDSQEAKDFTKIAFEISEKFDTPVLLRVTTRISHSKSIVQLENRKESEIDLALQKDPAKLVMIPKYARERHKIVEEKLEKLKNYAETFPYNKIEWNNKEKGIITSGISYQYAKEVFPNYSFFKLGLTYPLPYKSILEFASQIKTLYVIEELDPFLEGQIKALGINVIGKDILPTCGELNPDIIEKSFGEEKLQKTNIPQNILEQIPIRTPNLCAGCPHRGLFYILKKLKVFVTGDIGCYTLGVLPPLQAIDTCVCMGGGIGHALGLEKALKEKTKGKLVAVIGDSTFFHSGMTPLLDIVYNKGHSTVIILDNRTTAMTGRQDHPGTGMTLKKETTKAVDIQKLANALGVERVRVTDAYDLAEIEKTVVEEINSAEPSVIVNKGPCILIQKDKETKPLLIDTSKCTGCKQCLQLGCPAIEWKKEEIEKKGKSVKGYATINSLLCNGCSLCLQVCKFEAIIKS